jgi:hypothetical protein
MSGTNPEESGAVPKPDLALGRFLAFTGLQSFYLGLAVDRRNRGV